MSAPARALFPFSAVVGHDDAKLALLLAAIDPAIGGVLLRGQKGSAKTTLARGLAALLPGDAPFADLPLGATEDGPEPRFLARACDGLIAMCGICGQFNFRSGAPVVARDIQGMTGTLVHRGPDDEGSHVSGAIGLGFRRLSIIDLAGGQQRIVDQHGLRNDEALISGEAVGVQHARPRGGGGAPLSGRPPLDDPAVLDPQIDDGVRLRGRVDHPASLNQQSRQGSLRPADTGRPS